MTSTQSSSRALTALRGFALELSEAFDDLQSQDGAQEMLSSVDRMLELLAARD